MNLYSDLYNLYSEYWENLINTRSLINKSNGPYLSSPDKVYQESKFKIVFVGQETNKWPSKDDVSTQMEAYANFGLGLRPKIGKPYKRSPFWNSIRKIEMEVVGAQYCCVALNLNRFDVNGKPPREKNLALIEKLDPLLRSEIQVLKPDAVIFFTGWKYDKRLENILNTPLHEVSGFKKRELAEFKPTNEGTKIFRTYHPNYLRRSGKEAKITQEIINRLIS